MAGFSRTMADFISVIGIELIETGEKKQEEAAIAKTRSNYKTVNENVIWAINEFHSTKNPLPKSLQASQGKMLFLYID
jgi:hypothetical protein